MSNDGPRWRVGPVRVMPTDWKPTEQYLRAQNRMYGRIMAVLGVVFVVVAAILWHL